MGGSGPGEGGSAGGFVLGERIRSDAFGSTYLAQGAGLENVVLVRFLAHGLSAALRAAETFLAQARRLAGIGHPLLGRIAEMGEAEGWPFYAVQLPAGAVSLARRLESGPLEAAQACRIFTSVAEAAGAAHLAGLAHGQIDSHSIFVGGEGQPFLVGFPFAPHEAWTRWLDYASTESLPYASPEVCAGEPPGPRSDVWSLAASLYTAITARAPFEGVYGAAIVYAVQHDEPEPAAEAPAKFRERLEPILRKALAKSPTARYQDGADFSRALTAGLQTGRPAYETGPVTVRRRTAPPAAHDGRPFPMVRLPRRRMLLAGAPFTFLIAVLGWRFWTEDAPVRRTGRAAVAVLPLRDLSPGPDEDYLADGLTDELITALSKIGALRVTSRTSVMQYKERPVPPREAAEELHVDYLVEGSIQRQGSRIRVNATLIDPKTDRTLWGQSFEYELTDVFALQSEAARQIAARVHVKLTPDEEVRLAGAKRVRAASYESYLRGRYLLNRRGQALAAAKELFQQIAGDDPGFALAYAGIADACVLQANSGQGPPDAYWIEAREALERALQLDSELGEAYSTRALVRSFYEWDWARAEDDYLRAIRLNASDAVARQRYGIYLSRLGRHEEAIAELEQALSLDPLSVAIAHSAGVALFMARRYDDALQRFEANQRASRNDYRTRWYIGRCHLEQGHYAKAVEELEAAYQLSQNNSFLEASLAYTLARAGLLERAQRLADGLEVERPGRFVSAASLAVAHLGMARYDKALQCLEDALSERAGLLVWLRVDPAFDPLRNEPRFHALLRSVGLE